MKKAVLLAVAAVLACACDKTPTARIQGSTDVLKDTTFTLQKLSMNKLQVTDTVKVDGLGEFSHKVKLDSDAPSFYYLCNGDKAFATVILLPGDEVSIKVCGEGFQVEGSPESELLRQINEEFTTAKEKMMAAPEEAGATYVKYKRYAVKHMIDNPRSITSAAIAFQKFNDNLPVFGEVTDAIIFKQLYDSIKVVYPTSEYVKSLGEEAERRSRMLGISTMLNTATTASFPDITLPDINGEKKSLSDFSGKVTILSFWSVTQADQKMFNVTLADIYAKYHGKGLEIYQVSLDVDKPLWASTVKSQGIGWTSVNDGYGNQSPAVASYNVTNIPAMFVIDRNGEIIGRDIFDGATLESFIVKHL